MPNRILRDCTDSEKINQLDAYAERFFYRLIMIVDDYGRFYAHPGLLKAKMFPFLLDKIREADISRWKAECLKAGLIALYEIAGKEYLQIEDFRQRLDKAKEKFPSPISGNSITIDNDFREFDNDFPAEKKQKLETETRKETEVASLNTSDFKKNKKPKIEKSVFGMQENVFLTLEEFDRLVQEFGNDTAVQAVNYLSDYKIEKNYKTANDNLTIRRWVISAVMEKENGKNKKNSRSETIKNSEYGDF